MRAEASLDDDVYSAGEHAFQFFDQSQIVTEATIFRHVDQQIDITVWPLFMAQHRAEQAQVRRTMTRGDGEKLLTAAMEIVAQCHDDVPGVGAQSYIRPRRPAIRVGHDIFPRKCSRLAA
jgi:hypothetical protein